MASAPPKCLCDLLRNFYTFIGMYGMFALPEKEELKAKMIGNDEGTDRSGDRKEDIG